MPRAPWDAGTASERRAVEKGTQDCMQPLWSPLPPRPRKPGALGVGLNTQSPSEAWAKVEVCTAFSPRVPQRVGSSGLQHHPAYEASPTRDLLIQLSLAISQDTATIFFFLNRKKVQNKSVLLTLSPLIPVGVQN